MKAVYIGSQGRTAEMATLALHLRWPDTTPLMATTSEEGLELVEPGVVPVDQWHPDDAAGEAIDANSLLYGALGRKR